MLDLFDKIADAAAAISNKFPATPRVGIILGTGLGGIVDEIDIEAAIDYSEIPHFPTSTATSHRGRLVCGTLSGVPVLAMEGRFHYYEGYPLKQITLPVRVFKELGADLMVVSNACGGLNPYFNAGDIMVIEDQINLLGDNPLIGINDDRLGPRFPDMCEPYNQQWIDRTIEIARREGIGIHKGVFVAVAGPNLGNACGVSFPENDRGGCRWNEHRSRDDCCGALWFENGRVERDYRYVFARCFEALQRR